MKCLALLFGLCATLYSFAQSCDPANGNVVIYANYDGGILNINVDEDIPNLKIGVCTYENCQVNITGAFAGNVTEVIYAGFQGDNDNCNQGVNQTTITGVSPAISQVLFAPSATTGDPNGWSSIICSYSCGDGNQGGCNTATQVVDYFLSQFGGSLHSYFTQYACFSGVYDVSDNLCCNFPPSDPDVSVSASVNDELICVGQCVDFAATATGGANQFTWSFPGAVVNDSSLEDPQGICYLVPGTYTASVTASNGGNSDVAFVSVTVTNCGIPGCTYIDALNYNPNATVDDQSCLFEGTDCNDCLGDLDDDGIINSSDLLVFLGVFATPCPN